MILTPTTTPILFALAGTQTPGDSGTGAPPPAWTQFVPLIFLLIIFYVILIRPQQKRMKEHQKLVSNLKKGDRVATSGGMIGTIVTVKEKTLTVRSSESKLEIKKDAVAEVLEKSSAVEEEE